MSKAVLVTGATGKQGGSVVDAILAGPGASDFMIIGVTRNSASPSALKLKEKSPAIKIVQGDLKDCPALFKSALEVAGQPIWGVFSVGVPMGGGQSVETEEKYGKALVTEALKNNVKHFVYTSVERGGDEKSWDNPTPVPHFISKHEIEHHLWHSSANTQMLWTILRPVAFMDNLTLGMMGSVFPTAWKDSLQDKPLQIVAVKDIGWFAAEAFRKPEEFQFKAIGLAGDELTYAQMNAIFKNFTGKDAPLTYSFLISALLYLVKDIGLMFTWFRTEGYSVDIPKLRKMHPELKDFETWLRNDSDFKAK